MENFIIKPSNNIEYTKNNGFLYHDYMKEKIKEYNLEIPKIIFQTHKSIEYVKSNKDLVKCYKSWDDCKKYGFKHYFYSDDSMNYFMMKNFPDIYSLFENLPLPVLKADLFRYCIIYIYGGIYADMDTVCSVNPTYFITPSLLVCFPENNPPLYLCQWVFAAPPKSPIIKTMIDLSVERIKNFDFNNITNKHFIHYLTGPALFTDAIEKWLYENNFPVLKIPNTNNIVDMRKYVYYHKNTLNVLRKSSSHQIPCLVNHLYSGSWNDGWKNQREKFIKK